ncbi:ankyrin repeat and sterile alpha motif domain-containing protein 1B-like isoform X8 [Biomphalaria glabrata]|uniref:Ankyrin repeat and sterile alpha motif domain-containing protein 1B-like isoform X8 n=1 Tax=Biomphalaria glabrata TaxID=6526 RepID=A0A9W3A9K2_BIOGL|nr:ankyrin repeat and sterile alpha motif domain-containing protein 1B-like isoform X8 [Biomphalaria glabrata]
MSNKRGHDSGYEDEQNDVHILCQKSSLGEIITFLQSSPRGSRLHWYYDGETALHATVLSGRKDVCEVMSILLDHGADINAQTVVEGNTALHLVILHGVFPRDVDTIVFFLERKADLNIRNKKLRTPYDCAIANGHYELAGIVNGTVPPDKAKELYLQKCRSKYGPEIIQAILESNGTKLKHCLELGGDPNVLNKHGAGAIHYTVTHCKLPVYDTLLLLLESGADANLKDEEGDSALNLVIKNTKLRNSGVMVQCAQLLIDWGALAESRDVDGKNAHDLALEKNYTDVAAVLKKKEPEPIPVPAPVKDEPKPEPLKSLPEVTLLEDENERHKEIKSLLDKGVDINQRQESTGNTALHICAERNYGSTAQLLLDHNIDSKLVNKKGQTAYVVARMNKSTPVMKAIFDKQKKDHSSAQDSSACIIL